MNVPFLSFAINLVLPIIQNGTEIKKKKKKKKDKVVKT